MRRRISRFRFLFAAALALSCAAAQAAAGVAEIAGKDGDGPVTVYYSSSGEAQPVKRGRFTFDLAPEGGGSWGGREVARRAVPRRARSWLNARRVPGAPTSTRPAGT
jgi:hypothetical protein